MMIKGWSLSVDNNDGGEEDCDTDAGGIGNSDKDGDFDDDVDEYGGGENKFIPDLQPASRGSCCVQHIVSFSPSPSMA